MSVRTLGYYCHPSFSWSDPNEKTGELGRWWSFWNYFDSRFDARLHFPDCFPKNMRDNYCRMWKYSNSFHDTVHRHKRIAWKQSVFPSNLSYSSWCFDVSLHVSQLIPALICYHSGNGIKGFRSSVGFIRREVEGRANTTSYHTFKLQSRNFWVFFFERLELPCVPPPPPSFSPWSLFSLLIILKWNSLGVWEMCCKR